MNKKITFILTRLLLAVTLASATFANASAEHGHGHEEQEQATGPHGGILLEKEGIALELSIYEIGVVPEMRVYAYQDDEPISVDNFSLAVTLTRLGNKTQTLSFIADKNYLVSEQAVSEPHSFDVAVKARIKNQQYQWQFEQHQGRTHLSERAIKSAAIKLSQAVTGNIESKETLFGVIAPTTERQFTVMSPYAGVVENILVAIGDTVTQGQALLTVKNSKTLQSFTIKSPAAGVITEQFVNAGTLASEQPLLEVVDLSQVWVELSAFPENIEAMAVGQTAKVYDLHKHLKTTGEVFYLAPMMSGGHIARARVLISNPDGHWRPGMHVKADIITNTQQVSVRIAKQALQTMMNKPVVFTRFGDAFEAQPVTLGASDENWVEVVSGLSAGDEYVIDNSYVLKADVLKAGASHAH